MADYIYLLENRLSAAQRNALRAVRELARSKNLTVFLVGGAVRDLTSGSPVRDLDVVVQGNALKLKKDIEQLNAAITGQIEQAQALFVTFPGGVRMEIGSTLSVTYPKPGKPLLKPSSILDDLRRRDFTANAMALSLNEGSYGLLMDPLNGVADIENRELRLVSNYGFIEDPIRMVRAARLMARLGWTLDEKTQQRYETGKQEGYISSISDLHRGYETEEIVHEEDPIRVLKRLETEGWMQHLAPFWTSAKADVAGLELLRETQTQLQMQGIYPEAAAANFPLLTAKLSAKELDTLKSRFVRQGFVKDVESLEAKAKELGALLTSKAGALPSQTWKIITSAAPEAVLWVAYSSKSPAIKEKFKNFSALWPQARTKMPYALMQEMRIVPELPGYEDLLEKLFFELMDDKLQTPEEMKAFLEPFSPPAPPPPVSLRRPRAAKKESKAGKSRAKKAVVAVDEDTGEPAVDVEASDDLIADVEEALTSALEGGLDAAIPGPDLIIPIDDGDAADPDFDDQEEDVPPATPQAKSAAKPATKTTTKTASASAAKQPEKTPAKYAIQAAPVKTAPAKKAVAPPAKKVPVKAAPARKSAPAKAAKLPAKKAAPPANKVVAKKAVKAPPGKAPAKAIPAKNAVARKTTAAKSSARKAVPAKKTPPAKVPAKKFVPAKKQR